MSNLCRCCGIGANTLVASSLPTSASNLTNCCLYPVGATRKHKNQDHIGFNATQTQGRSFNAGEHKPTMNSVGSMMSSSSTDDYINSSPSKHCLDGSGPSSSSSSMMASPDLMSRHSQRQLMLTTSTLQPTMKTTLYHREPPVGIKDSKGRPMNHSAPQNGTKQHPSSAPTSPTIGIPVGSQQLASLPPMDGFNVLQHQAVAWQLPQHQHPGIPNSRARRPAEHWLPSSIVGFNKTEAKVINEGTTNKLSHCKLIDAKTTEKGADVGTYFATYQNNNNNLQLNEEDPVITTTTTTTTTTKDQYSATGSDDELFMWRGKIPNFF